MKKPRSSTLKLSRETLRQLDPVRLREPRGGDSADGTQARTCGGGLSVVAACSGLLTHCADPTKAKEDTCV